MHALVVNVIEVNAAMTRNIPPYLLLKAKGTVPTLGWTDAQLNPAVYMVEPSDGIWDFFLMAKKPTGIVGDAFAEIWADLTVVLPKWCRGVRVHASNNKVEHLLADSPAIIEPTRLELTSESASRDPGDAWPWTVNPETIRLASSNHESLMSNPKNNENDKLSVQSLLGRKLRVIHPGQSGDMMVHPNRVTFYLDENGEIESWLPF